MAQPQLPLLKGTLDLLVLKTLSWGPQHGFGIAQWLEQRSEGAMTLDDGALYHALHRLEARGSVKGSWAITENGRRARYYKLTPAGRNSLRQETDTWNSYARMVGNILSFVPLKT
jgi:transcriptional regulator